MSELQVQTDLTGKKHFIFTGERTKPKEYPQDTKKKTGLAKYGDDEK